VAVPCHSTSSAPPPRSAHRRRATRSPICSLVPGRGLSVRPGIARAQNAPPGPPNVRPPCPFNGPASLLAHFFTYFLRAALPRSRNALRPPPTRRAELPAVRRTAIQRQTKSAPRRPNSRRSAVKKQITPPLSETTARSFFSARRPNSSGARPWGFSFGDLFFFLFFFSVLFFLVGSSTRASAPHALSGPGGRPSFA